MGGSSEDLGIRNYNCGHLCTKAEPKRNCRHNRAFSRAVWANNHVHVWAWTELKPVVCDKVYQLQVYDAPGCICISTG